MIHHIVCEVLLSVLLSVLSVLAITIPSDNGDTHAVWMWLVSLEEHKIHPVCFSVEFHVCKNCFMDNLTIITKSYYRCFIVFTCSFEVVENRSQFFKKHIFHHHWRRIMFLISVKNVLKTSSLPLSTDNQMHIEILTFLKLTTRKELQFFFSGTQSSVISSFLVFKGSAVPIQVSLNK